MKLRPSEAINLAGRTDEELGRRHLSHSSISLLLACPRKFDLHYGHKLELIERPRPLSLGSAFQKAIEAQEPQVGVHELRGDVRCEWCDDGDEQIKEDIWVTCTHCEGEVWIPGPNARMTLTQEQEDRLRVDEAIVEAASTAYLKQWPAGPGETREFEYRVRLRNPATGAYSKTFDLLGYADGLKDIEHGELDYGSLVRMYELQENKLVGQITATKVQRLPLDRQVALARYGIWRATGRKVETVRYRWTKKPAIRQKQNETVEEYCERIRQDYVDRPDFYLHEEEPQFATTGDLLRIEAELWEWAEMVRGNDKRNIYPRNTSHCGDYGGCQFIPICTLDPDAMSLYRTRDDQPEPAEAIA